MGARSEAIEQECDAIIEETIASGGAVADRAGHDVSRLIH